MPYKESPLPIAKQIVNHRNTAYLAPLRKWFTYCRGAPQPHAVVHTCSFWRRKLLAHFAMQPRLVVNAAFIKIVDRGLSRVYAFVNFMISLASSCLYLIFRSQIENVTNENNRRIIRLTFNRAAVKESRRNLLIKLEINRFRIF